MFNPYKRLLLERTLKMYSFADGTDMWAEFHPALSAPLERSNLLESATQSWASESAQQLLSCVLPADVGGFRRHSVPCQLPLLGACFGDQSLPQNAVSNCSLGRDCPTHRG